jgi:hypothetical protein
VGGRQMTKKQIIALAIGGFLAAVLLDSVFSNDYYSAYTLAVLFIAKVCYYLMILGSFGSALAAGIYTNRKIPKAWAYIPAALIAFFVADFVFDTLFMHNSLISVRISKEMFSIP